MDGIKKRPGFIPRFSSKRKWENEDYLGRKSEEKG